MITMNTSTFVAEYAADRVGARRAQARDYRLGRLARLARRRAADPARAPGGAGGTVSTLADQPGREPPRPASRPAAGGPAAVAA